MLNKLYFNLIDDNAFHHFWRNYYKNYYIVRKKWFYGRWKKKLKQSKILLKIHLIYKKKYKRRQNNAAQKRDCSRVCHAIFILKVLSSYIPISMVSWVVYLCLCLDELLNNLPLKVEFYFLQKKKEINKHPSSKIKFRTTYSRI